MKKRHVKGYLLILVVLKLLLGITTGRAAQPSFTKFSFVGNDVAIVSSPGTTNWVALDASADLHSWVEVVNLVTTNNADLFLDEDVAQLPCRFYRLRQPGTTVDEASASWLTNLNQGYQFQLEVVKYQSNTISVLTGTVIITNGQKVISNAQVNSQPLLQPDPIDFPSIEEVFNALKSAQEAGCRQVRATYDPMHQYPVDCFIDQRVAAVPPQDHGHAVRYLITGVTINGS